MICKKCGKYIPDGNKFCVYCGYKVEIPVQPVQQPQVQSVPVQQPQPQVQTAPPQQLQTPVQTVPAQQPQPSADISNAVNTLVYQVQSENRKNKALVVVIAILVIVIAAGVGAFFALGGTDLFAKEEEKEGESTTVQDTTLQQLQPTNPGDYTTLPPVVEAPVTQYPTTNSYPQYTTPTTGMYDEPTTMPQQVPFGYMKTSTGLLMPDIYNYEGICEAYNDAVNNYRSYRGEVTLHRVENIDVSITSLSVKALEGVISDVITALTMPVDETFVFVNGTDPDGRIIESKIIPYARDASVTTDDVYSASIYGNSDGGYTISLEFLAESTSFDGTITTEPVHHMTAMDPLNLGSLDLGPIEMFSADMYYPGATVELTVDGQGRLVELICSLPLEAECTSGVGFIKFELGLEGYMDTTYEMSYTN